MRWAEGSESDLDAVVVSSVAVVLCAVGVVGAVELHGILRTFALGLAVVAGLYAVLMLVPLFVILTWVYLFKGVAGSQRSATR